MESTLRYQYQFHLNLKLNIEITKRSIKAYIHPQLYITIVNGTESLEQWKNMYGARHMG